MLASETTELRGYGFPYGLRHFAAMSLQDDRRASFVAWMKAHGLNMGDVATASGVSYNTIRSYVGDKTGKQTASLTGVNEAKIASGYNLTVEDIFGSVDDDQQPNHLPAWRTFRHLTQAELANRLGVPVSAIEYLEASPSPPSGKWLRRLAPALDTMAGFLLDVDPNSAPPEYLEAATEMARAARATEEKTDQRKADAA